MAESNITSLGLMFLASPTIYIVPWKKCPLLDLL